jgi:hypothetical protein
LDRGGRHLVARGKLVEENAWLAVFFIPSPHFTHDYRSVFVSGVRWFAQSV